MDKENWTEAGAFEWQRDGDVKVFTFTERPNARYIKLNVTAGVGNYGSGREIYVFKVPERQVTCKATSTMMARSTAMT